MYRDERKDVEQANDREELRLPDCFFSLHVGVGWWSPGNAQDLVLTI